METGFFVNPAIGVGAVLSSMTVTGAARVCKCTRAIELVHFPWFTAGFYHPIIVGRTSVGDPLTVGKKAVDSPLLFLGGQ